MTMTYKAARQKMLGELAAMGWTVKPDLKVAHATSPDGEVRLWFKAQAVHFTACPRTLGRHDLGDARALAYDLDIRTARTVDVVSLALARTGRNRSPREDMHF